MKLSKLSINVWLFSCLLLLLLGCSSENDSESSFEKIESPTKPVLSEESVSPAVIPTVETVKVLESGSVGVAVVQPTVATKLETPTTVPKVSMPIKSIPTNTPTVNSLVPNQTSTQLEGTSQSEAVAILFQAGSVARYKIGEQFARLPTPITAIGETSGIDGKVYLNKEGHVSDSQTSVIIVDVQSLTSDENKRDNWVRRNGGIGSEIAIDVLEISGHSWPLPQTGDMKVSIKGDMTISEITNPVVWEGLLEIENKAISGTISTEITWDQFQLSKPRLPFIISVDDEIILELDVVAVIE